MAKENAIINLNENINDELIETFDLDELEKNLQKQLDEELLDLKFLKEDKEKIGNADMLGDVIKNIVWEQFLNQIAVTAGEDFVRDNRELLSEGEKKDRSTPISKEDVKKYHLDLSKDAHYLSVDNFEKGEMPTHNPNKSTYQQRYNDYMEDFQTDPNMDVKSNGNMRYNKKTKTYERYDKKKDLWVVKTRYNSEKKIWEDWDSRSESWKKKLAPDARKKFDTRTKDQKGTAAVAKDHTISVAEQIRDVEAAAFVDRDTRKDFAKSDANLNDLDARANSSKGDLTMEEWLNSEREGKKPSERFDIDEEELRKKDAEARKEYKKMKDEGKKKSNEEGKNSQKEEAFRIGNKAIRAVLMQLLSEFVREIIAKLVKWFKSSKKDLTTLLDSLKQAIHSFIGKMKQHIINVGDTLLTTVATAILGPIVGTIKKIWIMLKQGCSSLKNAIAYIKAPANKGKPIGRLLMEVGKIVIAGMTGIGAMSLGEVIEKGLMAIPIFAVQIPLLGSLANILGIFLGAVVAGIIGAIAINIIQKQIEKSMKRENNEAQIKKGNEVIGMQHQVQIINEIKLDRDKENIKYNISKRHQDAITIMKDSYEHIMENFVENFNEGIHTAVIDEEDVLINNEIDKASKQLDDLLTQWK